MASGQSRPRSQDHAVLHGHGEHVVQGQELVAVDDHRIGEGKKNLVVQIGKNPGFDSAWANFFICRETEPMEVDECKRMAPAAVGPA